MATLRIHRFVEGRKWVQDYTVEVTKGMTVLEALISIKEHQDPTLSFTCSCRSSLKPCIISFTCINQSPLLWLN